VLNSLGVVCYYTFSVKGFEENRAVFTPNSRSMQEQHEEKIYGRLTAEQASELDALLADGRDTAAKLRRFMRKYRLLFLATDRSVLNLPAIGKSMTFRLVGLPRGAASCASTTTARDVTVRSSTVWARYSSSRTSRWPLTCASSAKWARTPRITLRSGPIPGARRNPVSDSTNTPVSGSA